MREEHVFAGVIAILIICVTSLGLYSIHKGYEFENNAIKAGYVQEYLPGRTTPLWVKAKSSKCTCLENRNEVAE